MPARRRRRVGDDHGIARFGRLKLAFLRRFRPFEDGTPAHDHSATSWPRSTPKHSGVASSPGWPRKRSFGRSDRGRWQNPAPVRFEDVEEEKDLKGPIHVVSAFAARQRLVLGQVKVEEKSNEIVAIPKLLGMLEIEGAIVTIDAMGVNATSRRRSSTRRPITPRLERQSGHTQRRYQALRR